ncbi:unnamed product [Ostreococcus tauri]|uniref:Unnamed product n=2 Tax=Ostreococcus tauri TaxID=70448 RepID=A0A096PAA9_OSTTA|nr:unnamed product [Ostreococcus tauri]CEG01858.1 unnamed product [Ostreococcus tauri]|eukprot:XP_022841209.1 unnamed product [Ostreococcus tauri]
MRVLVGAADCARAGVAVVLAGFGDGRDGTFASVTSMRDVDDDATRAGAGVESSRMSSEDICAMASTPDVALIAVNARCDGSDGAALVSYAVLEAIESIEDVTEVCFICATRDEALELERRDEESFLAYEDVRNGARWSDDVGIVKRPLGERGVNGGDGVLAIALAALDARGTRVRALYAPAHARCSTSEALRVTHGLGRAVERSAFGLVGYDAAAVERLVPASSGDRETNESLYT